MSEQIIMLGTGSAMVTKCYNTCFLIKAGEETFLVDAGGGNGILLQIEKSGIKWNTIRNMFVTHSHTDHVIGAIWVIRKISSLILDENYTGNFNIYCHDETANTIETLCRLTLAPKFLKCLNTRIFIKAVQNGDKLKTDNLCFTFFDIYSDKTKQFGFNAVFLSGKTLVCLGDEPYNPKCFEYVVNKDYMMCEAFCLYSDKQKFKPYEKFHSTVLDAGRIAEKLNIKNLILYHTEDKTLSTRKEFYSKEAKTVFDGNVFVPDDLEIIEIN